MAAYVPGSRTNRSFLRTEDQYPNFGGTSTAMTSATPTLANTVGSMSTTGAYTPSFSTGKNFKTLADLGDAGGMFKAGYQSYITPDYIKRMAAERPDLFSGIADPSSLVTANMVEGESGQQQQGWNYDPQLENILSQYELQRLGASGLSDGRTNALVDNAGSVAYADTPYSYTPAKDTMKALTEAGLMAGAMFGGVGLAGAGPWSGLSELVGGTAAGGAGSTAAGGASIAEGGGLLGSAFADAAAAGGTLLPGTTAGALIPTGAELALAGGGSLLAGGGGLLGGSSLGGIGALPGSISGSVSPLAPETLSTGLPSTAASVPSFTAGTALSGSGGFAGIVDKLLGGGGKGIDSLGGLLGSIGQIYAGNKAADAFKDLRGDMAANFAPGSAYEKTLRQQLERRDAAAGRRSQYGPREVELQAQLAKMASGQGSTLADIIGKESGAFTSQLQGGMFGIKNMFDLYKLFGGGG